MTFIQPSADSVEAALASWSWLPLINKTPYAVTALGDVFFQADDGIWFLDRIEGTLSFAAQDQQELQQLLDQEDGQDHYLWYPLVEEAKINGMVLHEGECFDFKLAPILGGEVTVENLEIRDFELVLNIAGQVHEQIKDLPDGAAVDQINLK